MRHDLNAFVKDVCDIKSDVGEISGKLDVLVQETQRRPR